jgi:hypothetical protein
VISYCRLTQVLVAVHCAFHHVVLGLCKATAVITMAQEIYDLEAVDGIRMPWNMWPRSKADAIKCVLPFTVLYTPAKPTSALQVCPIAFSKRCHTESLSCTH